MPKFFTPQYRIITRLLAATLALVMVSGVADASTQKRSSGPVVKSVDFDKWDAGTYTRNMLNHDWDAPRWNMGVDEGRASVVADGRNQVLKVEYPKGQVGPRSNGISFAYNLPADYNRLFVRYRVKFGDDFDFRAGGKLPGFFGGERNTGGEKPNGKDGWSARMLFKQGGAAAYYLYHADQPRKYGQIFKWNSKTKTTPKRPSPVGKVYDFTPGKWHTVEQMIKMNTPGKSNGVVKGWIDGKLAIKITNVRFRDVGSFAIDGFYFNNFFGGKSDAHRTAKDEVAYFDDFVISTKRVGR